MTGTPTTGARADDVRWLNETEQHMWRTHLRSHHLLHEALDTDLERHGVSLSEYEILAWLSEVPGRRLRMSDLADKVVQSRSRLTHTATRLAKAGWVRREPCASDRRGVELVMTDEGFERLDRLARLHVTGVRRYLMDIYTPAEVEVLGELLGRLREHLEDPDLPRARG